MWRCKKCGSKDIKIIEEMGTRYSSNVDEEGQGIYETQKEDGSSDYYEFISYSCYDCEYSQKCELVKMTKEERKRREEIEEERKKYIGGVK